jgi:DNA-directed RNA polymerase III subunit RPC3
MVSKHEAELFALVVNDLYGELPSRILAVLFDRGRSTVAQLTRATSLDPRKTKHALCVLIQQNLLYHHTPLKGGREAVYEANTAACYNLLRVGKAVALIAEQHGPAEEDVAQTLLLTGHTKIEDMEKRVLANVVRATRELNGVSEDTTEAEQIQDTTHNDITHTEMPLGQIKSVSHLHQTLYNLLRADLIEVVGTMTFQSSEDIYRDIDAELASTTSVANQIKRGSERDRALADRFRDAMEEPKALKRQLDPGPNFAVKRRRLTNGMAGANGTTNGINGTNGAGSDDDLDEAEETSGPTLNPNAIIRLNFDKCVLELRNESLSKFVTDAVGEVTGQVFRALLKLLTVDVPKCGMTEEAAGGRTKRASTADILGQIDPSVVLSSGVGKANAEDIDVASAERVRGAPDADGVESDAEDDDKSKSKPKGHSNGGDDSDEEMGGDLISLKPHTNSGPSVTVRSSGDAPGTDNRTEQVRQHLLVLAESQQRFVRHCGKQGNGQWTIDIALLVQRLRDTEMDATIEQSHGRQGLRLTRILREKGRMEERPLMGTALLSKSDMHRRLLSMQVAGICDLQEVPRDNTRLAAKTTFLWYYDDGRCRRNMLANIFKTMVRLWQRLETERQKESLLLTFVSRKDVAGREAEVMIPEHYNKYAKHLEVQQKLMGQISRLEEVVSLLRDY